MIKLADAHLATLTGASFGNSVGLTRDTMRIYQHISGPCPIVGVSETSDPAQICISHKPGCMLATDLLSQAYARLEKQGG